MSGDWAIQKTKRVYLLVVAKHTSFRLSAEWLTGRLYAVECTVGTVMLSICQKSILCSKSVVGIVCGSV